MVGRHHHDHRGAGVLRAPAPLRTDPRTGVRRGHDHRHAPGDVLEDAGRQQLALIVREHELFGEVRKDRKTLAAGVDQEIDAAQLAGEVEVPAFGKGRWHDREDAADSGLRGLGIHGRSPIPGW